MRDCFLLTARIALHTWPYKHIHVYPNLNAKTGFSLELSCSHCLPFGALTTVYFLWFCVCISLNEYQCRSSHPFTYPWRRQQQHKSHSSVFCLLVRAYTAAAFACGRLSLYRPACKHTLAHIHARMSHLEAVLYLPTQEYTHAWTLLFFVCSTIRFSLSVSHFDLCVCLLFVLSLFVCAFNVHECDLGTVGIHQTVIQNLAQQHCERIQNVLWLRFYEWSNNGNMRYALLARNTPLGTKTGQKEKSIESLD